MSVIVYGPDGFPPLDNYCPRCTFRSVLRSATSIEAEDCCVLCGWSVTHVHRRFADRSEQLQLEYESLRDEPRRVGRPKKVWVVPTEIGG